MLGGQSTTPLRAVISSLLSSAGGSGGLAALVQQFRQAGLGETIQSWIGSGQNLPISADQLKQVFGADRMQQMAANAGMDQQQFGGQLSELLPKVVDRLTPDGQVPSGGVDSTLGMLSTLMPG